MQRQLIFAVLIACVSQTFAAQGFYWTSSVLYQPDDDLRTRLSSAEELAAYMKRIDAVCTAFFASEKTPEQLDIVVGLKPQKKVRVWFVSSRRTSQDKRLIALRKQMEAIPSCAVHGGPVAFALRCSIAGASPSKGDPPMPKEWHDAAVAGHTSLLVPDGIFDKIWRD
jgi:hypothetical protein